MYKDWLDFKLLHLDFFIFERNLLWPGFDFPFQDGWRPRTPILDGSFVLKFIDFDCLKKIIGNKSHYNSRALRFLKSVEYRSFVWFTNPYREPGLNLTKIFDKHGEEIVLHATERTEYPLAQNLFKVFENYGNVLTYSRRVSYCTNLVNWCR